MILTVSSAFAKVKTSDVYFELHKKNSFIARMLNPKNPQNIKKITKNIKSYQDRMLFEKLAVQKKGQDIKIYPFLDQLIIEEKAKRYVIQLISQNPLIVSFNNGPEIKIDPNNIQKSILNSKRNKNVFINAFVPEAHAWGEDDWGFMYSVAQSISPGGIVQLDSGTGKPTDDPVKFNEEVLKFLKKYDINNLNCSDVVQAGDTSQVGKDMSVFGASFISGNGDRFVFSCSEVNSCKVQQAMGVDIQAPNKKYDELYKKLIQAVSSNAKKMGDFPGLDVNDFDLQCETKSGAFSSSNECMLILRRNIGTYTDKTRDALMFGNVASELNEEQQKDLAEFVQLSKNRELTSSGGYNEKFIIKSLVACCKDTKCSTQARQDFDFKMSTGAPEVSK